MEADKAILQDLEGFGEEKFFKMAIEKFRIFVLGSSKIS